MHKYYLHDDVYNDIKAKEQILRSPKSKTKVCSISKIVSNKNIHHQGPTRKYQEKSVLFW